MVIIYTHQYKCKTKVSACLSVVIIETTEPSLTGFSQTFRDLWRSNIQWELNTSDITSALVK